jgi:2-phospho-L-lactate guanylyltransferase
VKELYALIPVKDPARGKSRLAPVLDEPARQSLSLRFAQRTLAVCLECFGARRTVVVSTSARIRELAAAQGALFVQEPGSLQGLNPALGAAAQYAREAGAAGIAVVPTDLVLLSRRLLTEAIEALPEAPGCVLVPDRRGTGTNLLCMSPDLPEIFSFGEASLRRHAARARHAGLEVRIHCCPSLAFDLDLPEDFNHLEATQAWPTFASTTLKPSASPSDSIRT